MGEAGYVLAVTGHPEEARPLLKSLNSMIRRGTAFPIFAALIHIGLQEPEEALNALQLHARLEGTQGIFQWHALDQLKTDPRYQKLTATH
jgi:hypothetical protein